MVTSILNVSVWLWTHQRLFTHQTVYAEWEMFIWPWALIRLIGRASFLMNFQKESATFLSWWHFESVIAFHGLPPLMNGREPNYQWRPSGFISVTRFNRWVLWLLIRLGPESALLMRKLSSQEPWYTNKTTIQLIITYCLIMSWETWAIITSSFFSLFLFCLSFFKGTSR